jgi:hypothetical protein
MEALAKADILWKQLTQKQLMLMFIVQEYTYGQ